MTNLNRLKVSLTKHGAHKIALLLRRFDKDQILNHLSGSVAGINIEHAQAVKNLSVNDRGEVPNLWNDVKALGDDAINALVFLAIVFSHNGLIEAMQNSANKRPFRGVIRRDEQLAGKAYTNFAHTVHELGFSSEALYGDDIRFDVQKIFEIKGLGLLAAKLLKLKLIQAGWNQSNTLIEECKRLNFHGALAVSSDQLELWLSAGMIAEIEEELGLPKDVEFFTEASDAPVSKKFKFTSGHNRRKTGRIRISAGKTDREAELLHNNIQNQLFEHLAEEYGAENVGTEVDTGQSTAVDIVVRVGKKFHYYEIKTASSVKACIRQAIPQLLEYAYWKGELGDIESLIIVSPHPITDEAEAYLGFLRKQFGLPIQYLQFEAAREAAA